MEQDRRLTKRISIGVEAYIFAGGKTYTGSIENVSVEGFEFSILTQNIQSDFNIGKKIELYFQIPSGETLALLCEVQWSFLENTSLTLGIKLKSPSSKYNEFIKTLDIVSVN